MFKRVFRPKKRILDKLTLENLRAKMFENHWDKAFVTDLMAVLQKRKDKIGAEEFKEWLYHLSYALPEEFHDEKTAMQFYLSHREWIEEEIGKLEKETKLTWQIQAEDLKNPDDRVKKAQLVIRHRLSDAILNVQD